MATIQELLPYLHQGCTLQNVRGESIRKLHENVAEFRTHDVWGKMKTEKRSLVGIAALRDIWEWGVVFCRDGKNHYILTGLEEIETALKNKVPIASYGEQAGTM